MIRVVVFFLLAFFVVGLGGVAHAADKALIEAVKKEGKLSIYTSITPREMLDRAEKLFQKKYGLGSDFKIIMTRKGTGAVMQMVEAEKMAGSTKWDIVSHSDESVFLRWIDAGMLMKYQPPNIDNIREVFRDPDGYTVPNHFTVSCIAIDKNKVKGPDRPKKYSDLLDPKWGGGRIGTAHPATAGPAVMFTRFMLDLYGWQFYAKLAKNKPLIVKGNSALPRLLLSGEIDVALNPNEHNILDAIHSKGGDNLEVIYPEEGSAYFRLLVAANKEAMHPNAAKLWLEFTVSDEWQRVVADIYNVPSKTVKPKIARPEYKLHKIDWQWLKLHKDEMAERFSKEIR